MELFSAAALAATAVAADTEHPVISLDMDALSDYANIMKLKNSVVRSHDLGYKNNGADISMELAAADTSCALVFKSLPKCTHQVISRSLCFLHWQRSDGRP